MIAHEQHAPVPFSASATPLESPRNAYELIKLELMNFVDIYYGKSGRMPRSEELQFDACRIIFAAEIPSFRGDQSSSWLRDLIMSSERIMQRAKLSPLRSATESRLTFLQIIGKENPFESCPFEARLMEFVQNSPAGSLGDLELQQEACRILQHMERESSSPADIPATWLLELARSSTSWLRDFRQRANFPRLDVSSFSGSTEQTAIDAIINNYNELEEKLAEHIEILKSHGIDPDDDALRQQALRIISEFDNEEWKAAAAENHSWLSRFKRRHLPWSNVYVPSSTSKTAAGSPATFGDRYSDYPATMRPNVAQDFEEKARFPSAKQPSDLPQIWPPNGKIGHYVLNDPNFDRFVARELARWVAATMSPHNPNQHLPTDHELQHQARWIMYEE